MHHLRIIPGAVIGISLVMILIRGFHIGGPILFAAGIFAPLAGALIGGLLTLISVNIPLKPDENREPWLGYEKIAWVLIGCGCLVWGMGEGFWRYMVALGKNPFPSFADIGYSGFFPLVFAGLILQQYSTSRNHRRAFLALDSLIAMGTLLSIAWYLRLGALAQSPPEAGLKSFLSLYYLTTDVALLSCTVFLLLREHDHLTLARARRISLIVVGLGLTIFALSDFLFNLWLSLGMQVDGSWVDLGWPIGIMAIGLAAYLRRFLPAESAETHPTYGYLCSTQQFRLGLPQALPFILLVPLFFVIIINILSNETVQQHIRPVLIIATLIVFCLVIIREIVTILENNRLVREQMMTLKHLEMIYQEIEQRKKALELGITHLKEVQARLANGDLRARAHTLTGNLWPLANGLNLMADRMMRSEQQQRHAQKALQAITDLCLALEQRQFHKPFVLPASYFDAPPEVHHLLQIIGINPLSGINQTIK